MPTLTRITVAPDLTFDALVTGEAGAPSSARLAI
jgi:hypothetical protein